MDEAFRRRPQPQGGRPADGAAAGGDLAHRLETLFSRVREGTLRLDAEVLPRDSPGAGRHRGRGRLPGCRNVRPPNPRVPRRPSTGSWRAGGPQAAAAHPGAPCRMPARRAGAAPAPAPRPVFQAVETVRVSADNLDRLLRSTGQLLTESLRQNLVARDLTDLSRQIAGHGKGMGIGAGRGGGVAAAAGRHARVWAASPAT